MIKDEIETLKQGKLMESIFADSLLILSFLMFLGGWYVNATQWNQFADRDDGNSQVDSMSQFWDNEGKEVRYETVQANRNLQSK